MKLQILSSSTDGSAPKHYALSMLVNGSVCIDAGCLGFVGEPADQERVRHLFLTHAHIDHIASLPIFLENVFTGTRDCVRVHASAEVHRILQEDMFNDRIWPDFIKLSTPEAPFFERATLAAGEPVRVDGVSVTPVPVNHGDCAYGYIVDDGAAAFAFSGDTGPTDEFWAAANGTPNLAAVFLECSFPESLRHLASISHHLTPSLFAGEIRKLDAPAAIHPVLLKARYRHQTMRELEDLGLDRLSFPAIGEEFEL